MNPGYTAIQPLSTSSANPPSPAEQRIRSIWHRVVHALLNGHEPYVQPHHHSADKPGYCVYDPQTGRSTYLANQAEVRIWLDERFHR